MTATAQLAEESVSVGHFHALANSDAITTCIPASKHVALFGRCRKIPRGTHAFVVGDNFRNVNIVVSGSFKMYSTSLDGDERVLGFFLPGEALGLEAATSQTHIYSVVALEDSDVSEFSLAYLQGRFDNAQSQCHNELLQRLCLQSISNNYSVLQSRSSKFAEQRLGGFLLDLWDRRDETIGLREALSLTMSRQDIGDYLGLAPGTISRTFAQLEQQRLIEVRCRCVRILDAESLRRFACSERNLPTDLV